jgi:hypothetical protein
MTGTGALAGNFTSSSLFTGNLTGLGGIGQLTGVFTSSSLFRGSLLSGGPGSFLGLFASTSLFTGNLSGIPTPPTPGVCTNLWSADGNYKWTADGFTGWSSDGYEPTPLECAVTYFAAVGVNVGQLTYVYDALVPVGYVITGYVPYISTAYAGQYIPLVISLGPPPGPKVYTVPNVVGKFYYDAQLAILQAGFFIAQPVWGFSPPPAPDPQYVYAQSIAPGTQFPQPVQIIINVQGFPVVNQPGIVVPVP